eukprot:6164963-Pyramimonas_sp.AAC.1
MPAWCSLSNIGSDGGGPAHKDEDAPTAKKLKADKPKHKDIIVPIAKLVMANSKSIADLEGVAYVKYQIGVGRPFVAAGLAAGKRYDTESKELKKKAASGQAVDHKARGG